MSNIINTNSSDRTITIPNLVNGQIYRARVSAVNAYGQGPFTQYVYATPSLFAVDNDFYNVELLMDMDQTFRLLYKNYLGYNYELIRIK